MAFPPDTALPVTAELSALLDRAKLALCRLEGALGAHADTAAFVRMQLCREAVLSCRIENETSSLAAVLEAAGDKDPDEITPATEACLRCCQALECGLAAARGKPLNLDHLAAMQVALTAARPEERALAGRHARAAGRAGVEAGLAELDKFLTTPSEPPDIVRIGLAHVRLRRLLPAHLDDGRLERIAVLAMFRRLDLPGAGALALSPYLQARQHQYQTHVRKAGSPWLAFFVRGVAESATQAAEMVHRCASCVRGHRESIAAGLGHAVGRGLRVLGRLTSDPTATVSDIRAITGTSYVAANQLVARFMEMGILEEVTGFRRNRRFQYGPYLRIFDPDLRTVSERPRARSRPASKPPHRGTSGMPRHPSAGRSARPPHGPRRSPPCGDHLL